MTDLKMATVKKCFSLLREFIEEIQGEENKKGIAVLALDQLQRVTAGSTSGGDPLCIDNPRVDGTQGSPVVESQGSSGGDPLCIDNPRVDGTNGG